MPAQVDRYDACVMPGTGYRPTSRRPIAGMFRRTANAAVRTCVRYGVHPDLISYSSIVASAAAAACFWYACTYPVLLLAGPLFCYLRLWFNMLDGMVALASGTASWRGELLNDLPDRISDVLIFAGVAHSGLCAPSGGYWAAIAALLTAYVGVSGQAVGVRREFGGVMSKPWRMVAAHVGAWATFAQIWQGHPADLFGGWTIFDVTNGLIVLGCVQTSWVRLAGTMSALREREYGQAPDTERVSTGRVA